MYKDVIGIVGGMGSYATLSFFERLLNAFPGEKEWDRPRILIDNRCTMPSRVRAILYNEKVDEISSDLADSVNHLINMGATKIILACNTSHFFLPEIYDRLPESKEKIIDIIKVTANVIKRNVPKGDSVNLLASEGTINTGIFHKTLEKQGINILIPSGGEFEKQRKIIESVKQQKITYNEIEMLVDLINSSESDVVIIGCTEFPVVYELIDKTLIKNKIVIDPLQCVIEKIILDIK